MGLFGGEKRVSKDEFKKVRSSLYGDGLTDHKLDDVQNIFHGDMNQGQHGTTAKDLNDALDYMRKNMDKHHLTAEDLDKVEHEMKKRL